MPPKKGYDRKLISLPPDLKEEVSDFRFEARMQSESDAYQLLIRKGLEAWRREKAAGAKKPKE